ncbi:MAG: hypothetical protein Q4A34_00315 [Candidatus Saccharibacteria bacterium]|nr:hypothetical protein [Candidatus Saccharibacteria bacterium]
MTQPPTPDTPSRPTPEQSPHSLGDLYFRPLTVAEREQRDTVYQQRRLASRPAWPAWRIAGRLSGGIALILLGVHASNIALHIGGALSAVSCAFLWLLGAVYYYVSAVSYVGRFFGYRDVSPNEFWLTYGVMMTLAAAAGSFVGLLTIRVVLQAPLVGLVAILLVHGAVIYGLVGRWIGYGRH